MGKARNLSGVPSILGCLCLQLCAGILYLWSVFKGPAIAYYGWADSAANLVASFMLFSFCVGSLIGGTIQDRTGPRGVCILGCVLLSGGIFLASLIPAGGAILRFYLSYCLLGGLGCGFIYGSVISCMLKWMPHRRGLASGMAVSAFGLSTVVFSPLSSRMLDFLSLPITFRRLSILFCAVGLAACGFIRLPDSNRPTSFPQPETEEENEHKNLGQAIRTAPFWYLFLTVFFINGTWNIAVPLIKGLGMARGLSQGSALLTVSLTGLTSAAGRLSVAALSDRIGRTLSITLMAIVTMLCSVLLIFVEGHAYLLIILLAAFAYGGAAAIGPAICTDLFGSRYSGRNFGVIMLALGLSSVVFNLVSNTLCAAARTYTLSFVIGALSAAVSIVLLKMMKHRSGRSRSAASMPG